MERKVIIGTVTVTKDKEMYNYQFQYAASFERLLVKAGTYPIFAYESDIEKKNGQTHLGWRNYIGYEGTVIASNVGGHPGEVTCYNQMVRDYTLADLFVKGYNRDWDEEFELAPEWGIELVDFISIYDNKRIFLKKIVLKDGAEYRTM